MKRLITWISAHLLLCNVAFADMHMYAQHEPQDQLMTDGQMHVFFCGTGDPEIAMQSIRRPFCLAVIADKQFILFDSGEGSSQNLGALGLPLKYIKNLFVTHWHSDHMAGIGYVNNVSWLSGRDDVLTLFGPYGVKKITKALNQLYSLDEMFRSINAQGSLDINNSLIQAKEIKAPQKGIAEPIFKTDTMSVFPFLVNHNPVYPALGYVIQYKGCKLVISGDTRVDSNLIAVADKADVLINEGFSHALGEIIKETIKKQANSTQALVFFNQISTYHSDTLEVAEMAAKDQVKHLIITHLVPSIPTNKEAKESFIKGMKEIYSGPITVVDDRDELVIISKGSDCQVQYKPASQPEITTMQIIQSK